MGMNVVPPDISSASLSSFFSELGATKSTATSSASKDGPVRLKAMACLRVSLTAYKVSREGGREFYRRRRRPSARRPVADFLAPVAGPRRAVRTHPGRGSARAETSTEHAGKTKSAQQVQNDDAEEAGTHGTTGSFRRRRKLAPRSTLLPVTAAERTANNSRLISEANVTDCITISRGMREEPEKWLDYVERLGCLRFAGSVLLAAKLFQRGPPLASMASLIAFVLAQGVGSLALVGVVMFTTTEAPWMHCAAVLVYAGAMAMARWLHLSGFRMVLTPQEVPLEQNLTRLFWTCLFLTGVTLVVLGVNVAAHSPTLECLGGRFEWLTGFVDCLFLLLSDP
ncbi:hypothetical protein MTO96_048830 [Rhipicephalus appendiculatus]